MYRMQRNLNATLSSPLRISTAAINLFKIKLMQSLNPLQYCCKLNFLKIKRLTKGARHRVSGRIIV